MNFKRYRCRTNERAPEVAKAQVVVHDQEKKEVKVKVKARVPVPPKFPKV